MSGTDPGDPFRNPGWNPQDGYPAAPPTDASSAWAPPPTPPMPPPTPKKGIWPIVVAVVAGFAATLGVLGFLASSDDDDPSDEQATEADADDDERTTSTSTSTSTTSTTTSSSTIPTNTTTEPDLSDLGDPGGPVVTAGLFSLQIPAGWRGADLTGGTAGAGAAMFPDNPTAAQAVQAQLDLMPRAVQLIAFDASFANSPTSFASNVNVLIDPTSTSGVPLDQQLDVQVSGMRGIAEVADARVVELGGRQVGRITSEFQVGAASYGVASYLIDTGTDVVIVTYSFGELDAEAQRLADASVATFTAG